MGISKEILQSFTLSGDTLQLSGGQNTSIKVGNAVIKPVDNKQQIEWVMSVIYNLILRDTGYQSLSEVYTVLLYIMDGLARNMSQGRI